MLTNIWLNGSLFEVSIMGDHAYSLQTEMNDTLLSDCSLIPSIAYAHL